MQLTVCAALLCACACAWMRVCTADCDARVVAAIAALHPRPDQLFDGMLDHLDNEYQVMLSAGDSAEGQVPICMKGTFIGEKNGSKILEYSGFVNGAYSMTFKNGLLESQEEDEDKGPKLISHIVYFTHEVVALYTCPDNDVPPLAMISVSSWFIGKVDDQLKVVQDLFKQVGINSFTTIPNCKGVY